MNTRVGISFGLVLMLAIGVISAMLALGTFPAPKSHADVGPIITVTVSPEAARAIGQYTIKTTVGADLDVGERVFVRFNSSTTVPTSIDAANVKIKAGTLSAGTGDELRSAAAVAVSGNEVRITVPDMDSGTDSDQGIARTSSLTITFLQAAGITNPNDATPSTAYTLAMWTDAETDFGHQQLLLNHQVGESRCYVRVAGVTSLRSPVSA